MKSRHFVKSSDIKKFQLELQGINLDSAALFGKNTKMEEGTLEESTILYFIDGELTFIKREDRIFPFLKALLKDLVYLPKVVVDMGAIPHIIKGADIMFPGIVSFDSGVKIDDLVVIIDEKHNKPLAIGQSLVNDTEFSREKKGKAVKNLHYVGDKLWDFIKKIESK